MNKQTILFIPGMSCTKDIWEGLDTLPEHYHCHFLDWPLDQTAGFHTLEQFATWLSGEVLKINPDFFVGHSLGGLSLLKAQEMKLIAKKKTVVIESFLKSPPPFFRTFIGPYASKELEAKLHEMFNLHRDFFSEKFRLSLRDENAAPFVDVKQIEHTQFFYGMRGEEDPQKVLNLLPSVHELSDTNFLSLLPYSGHFPMIEEPAELEEGLMTFMTQ